MVVHQFLENCSTGLGDKYAKILTDNGFTLEVLQKTETEDLEDLFERLEESDRVSVVNYVQKARKGAWVMVEDPNAENKAVNSPVEDIKDEKAEESEEKSKDELKIGDTVIIQNLKSESGKNLNGKTGKVQNFVAEKGRYAVLVDGEKNAKLLKPENLVTVDQDEIAQESKVVNDVKADQNVEQREGVVEEELASLKDLDETDQTQVWVTKREGNHPWFRVDLRYVYRKTNLVLVANTLDQYNPEYDKVSYHEFYWRLSAPKGWEEPPNLKVREQAFEDARKRAALKAGPQKRKRQHWPPSVKRKAPGKPEVDPEKMKEIIAEMNEALVEYEPPARSKIKKKRFLRDLETYQLGYPADDAEYSIDEDKMVQKCKNLLFYKGLLSSKPDNCTIMEFHEQWFGKYNELEFGHGFIQWLFPIREQGLNHQVHKLYPHEFLVMRKSPEIRLRIYKSYMLILDFFGMELADGSGRLKRSKNWKECYRNLNNSFHNYLRITRILKCLGEMDMEWLKFPFLLHCLEEMFVFNQLRNCRQSCEKFWIPTLRNEKMRQILLSVFTKKESKRKDLVKAMVAEYREEHGLKPNVEVCSQFLNIQQLNGKVGTLKSFDADSHQWLVQFSGHSSMVRPAHVRRIPDTMEESEEEVEGKDDVQGEDEPKEAFESNENDLGEPFKGESAKPDF